MTCSVLHSANVDSAWAHSVNAVTLSYAVLRGDESVLLAGVGYQRRQVMKSLLGACLWRSDPADGQRQLVDKAGQFEASAHAGLEHIFRV